MAEGILVYLRKSKTDQEHVGRTVAIPKVRGHLCPVTRMMDWMKAAGISSGPVFRSIDRHGNVQNRALGGQSVSAIIMHYVALIGLDKDKFSGHSLRAGFVTNATSCGASSLSIRSQTGHKSDAMMERYIRQAKLFEDNPVSKVW